MNRQGRIHRIVVAILFLILAAGVGGTGPAFADTGDPALTLVAPNPHISGSVEVRGKGFTVDGEVWVAILHQAQDGSEIARTLQSTTATEGSIRVTFHPVDLTFLLSRADGPCIPGVREGASVVRAFDTTRGTWTEPIALGCMLATGPGQPVRFTP